MTDIPTENKTVTFTFTECKDGDNNYYPVVQINTQLWMAENLKTTKYNDGTTIPNITDDYAWYVLTTGAYSDYNNTPANSTIYGRLYNWFTVDNNAATKVASNGGKNVCPTGWHVSTDAEWTTLTTYLGGQNIAGGKLIETGTNHWLVSYSEVTNETGFTAIPGGGRLNGGTYYEMGSSGLWWSSTESSLTTSGYYWAMGYSINVVNRVSVNKRYGFSVRCLQD
jgi:uncharacterized protein (TIGR02145 family)